MQNRPKKSESRWGLGNAPWWVKIKAVGSSLLWLPWPKPLPFLTQCIFTTPGFSKQPALWAALITLSHWIILYPLGTILFCWRDTLTPVYCSRCLVTPENIVRSTTLTLVCSCICVCTPGTKWPPTVNQSSLGHTREVRWVWRNLAISTFLFVCTLSTSQNWYNLFLALLDSFQNQKKASYNWQPAHGGCSPYQNDFPCKLI